MTFSIVARDPDTGDLGVAVASKFLAVGSIVPWASADAGAVATQAWANVSYGPRGLEMMADGVAPASIAERLVASDEARDDRQFGLVDAAARAVTYTGANCLPWAGGRTSDGVAVQGNILAGPGVVEAMLAAFESAVAPLPDRLLDALLAGDLAGGDRRGRQSAALLVVRRGGGYGGDSDRWLDLRVDDHPDPVAELIRIRGIARLLMERPQPGDLIPIDDALARELRTRLEAAGWSPGREDAFAARMRAAVAGTTRIGTERTPPSEWDTGWDAALVAWMAVANLEERLAAVGWLDPAVLAELRTATAG